VVPSDKNQTTISYSTEQGKIAHHGVANIYLVKLLQSLISCHFDQRNVQSLNNESVQVHMFKLRIASIVQVTMLRYAFREDRM
jgi:hypothetical protein